MKKRTNLIIFVMIATLLAGCGKSDDAGDTGVTAPIENADEQAPKDVIPVTVTEEAADEVMQEGEDTSMLSDDELDEIIENMDLRDKIAQKIIIASTTFKENSEAAEGEAVLTLHEGLKQALDENKLGGMIFFGGNYESKEQFKKLLDDINEENRTSGNDIPLFMAIDQEGGRVSRLNTGTCMPGNMALGATGDPENAKIAASVMGQELAALGINVNFAPVLDVNCNPANPVIGVRSFSPDPDVVSQYGAKFIEGIHENNLIATAKHFPGHGDTAVDSHTGLPQVDKSYDDIKKTELVPFVDNLDELDMIMTAHIQFPMIETSTYKSKDNGEEIYLPATLSKTILEGVLRHDYGYEGVVVTDSMTMGAIDVNFKPMDAAELALNAGVDILLMPVPIADNKSASKLADYIDGIVNLVDEGKVSEESVDESVLRILKLKNKYGMLGKEYYDTERPDLSVVGSKEHKQAEWEIAKAAVTLNYDRGVLPLDGHSDEKITFITFDDSVSTAVSYEMEKLIEEDLVGSDFNYEIRNANGKTYISEKPYLIDSDKIVIFSSISSLDQADIKKPENSNALFINSLLTFTLENGKKTVFVAMNLPYEADYYLGADASVFCYLPKGMTQVPNEGEECKSYGAMIPATVYELFGGASMNGHFDGK